jgi:hypothetical protein
VDLLSIASFIENPAETNNAVRAWGQQCEDSKIYQGMVHYVIFKFGLKSNQGIAAWLSEFENKYKEHMRC